MDTVFVVHVRSFGFFHSGRERLLVQVLKRTWEFIPGSTLYGAVCSGLIRLDGPGEPGTLQGREGYRRLLSAVAAGNLRFTPLIPVEAPLEDEELRRFDAPDFSRRTLALHSTVYSDRAPAKEPVRRSWLFTTPHAPLGRDTEQIHGDQLYALATHQAQQGYYGFIFGEQGIRPFLERALRMLPFVSLGGKGKFSLAEGCIVHQRDLATFQDELVRHVERNAQQWVRLLTPAIVGQGRDWLMTAAEQMVIKRFRRYRVWRTGDYYDQTDPSGLASYGMELGLGEDPGALRLPAGRESDPVTGIPERSRFCVDATQHGVELARCFVRGVGRPDWAALGWGQVVIE